MKKEGAGSTKNPHAVALGRLGGLKGGPARAVKLPPERRKEIAIKASMARRMLTSRKEEDMVPEKSLGAVVSAGRRP